MNHAVIYIISRAGNRRGGSIGSELCRQVAKCSPKQIVIFDIYENNAYELLCELKGVYGESIDIQVRIGSVWDMKRLEQIFREFRPSIVFHAAALSMCLYWKQSL
jgi:FlaA1/EpsC-like NDP-sugar epimerase